MCSSDLAGGGRGDGGGADGALCQALAFAQSAAEEEAHSPAPRRRGAEAGVEAAASAGAAAVLENSSRGVAPATYSLSAVDCATKLCFLEDQSTNESPKNKHVTDVLFLSILQPPKSASENARNEILEEAESQMPKDWVPCRYLKIRLTACRCDARGEA